MFLPLPTGDSPSRASWTYIAKVVIVGPGCNGCEVVRLFRRMLVDFCPATPIPLDSGARFSSGAFSA